MDASQNMAPPFDPEKEKKTASEEALQTFMQSFQTISEAFSEPEGIFVLLKGLDVLPDLFLKIIHSTSDSCQNFQNQWIEKSTRIGATTKAYQFENLDQEIFQAWSEIYEKEFQQYLNIPQLGLNRVYHERMNKAQDAFNVFGTKLSEFLFVLYLPIEKSLKVLQQQMTEKAKKGDLPENSRDYYRTWIKILEGHYMTLFQSREYTSVLNRTIDAMSEFKSRNEDVMGDILKTLAIPTQKELDELYKELYETKKRLRVLEKKFQDK
jgi:polyhydroxyalkanoate synthesis regulator phasin